MIYIDSHKGFKLDGEMKKTLVTGIKAGGRDEFGVKGLNLYYNDNRAFCLTDAPSIDAVRKSHKTKGIICDEIVEVKTLV